MGLVLLLELLQTVSSTRYAWWVLIYILSCSLTCFIRVRFIFVEHNEDKDFANPPLWSYAALNTLAASGGAFPAFSAEHICTESLQVALIVRMFFVRRVWVLRGDRRIIILAVAIIVLVRPVSPLFYLQLTKRSTQSALTSCVLLFCYGLIPVVGPIFPNRTSYLMRTQFRVQWRPLIVCTEIIFWQYSINWRDHG